MEKSPVLTVYCALRSATFLLFPYKQKKREATLYTVQYDCTVLCTYQERGEDWKLTFI